VNEGPEFERGTRLPLFGGSLLTFHIERVVNSNEESEESEEFATLTRERVVIVISWKLFVCSHDFTRMIFWYRSARMTTGWEVV
jgi:hypothetical protein